MAPRSSHKLRAPLLPSIHEESNVLTMFNPVSTPSTLPTPSSAPTQTLENLIATHHTDILHRLSLLSSHATHLTHQHTSLTTCIHTLSEYTFTRSAILARIKKLRGRKVVMDPNLWHELLIIRAQMKDMLPVLDERREVVRGEVEILLAALPRRGDDVGPGYLKPLCVEVVAIGKGRGRGRVEMLGACPGGVV